MINHFGTIFAYYLLESKTDSQFHSDSAMNQLAQSSSADAAVDDHTSRTIQTRRLDYVGDGSQLYLDVAFKHKL